MLNLLFFRSILSKCEIILFNPALISIYIVCLFIYVILSFSYYHKTGSISLIHKISLLRKYSNKNYSFEISFFNLIVGILYLYPIVCLFIGDYINLKDSLIFSLSKTQIHSIYSFIISIIMVFSLDIASVQFLSSNINKDLYNNKNKSIYYLNENKLNFLSSFYLIIHKFIRKKLFYIMLFLFTILPLVIFNKIFKFYYKNISIFLFAVWQTMFVIIIIFLILVIISDFNTYKSINYLKKFDNKVKLRINNKYIYNMKLLLFHDRNNNDKSFNYYISRLINKNNLVNSKKYITLSIRAFISSLLNLHSFEKHTHKKSCDAINFFILIKNYLSFLNHNYSLVTNKAILIFMKGYLKILNSFLSIQKKEFLHRFINFERYGINTLVMKNIIIPDFVFRDTDDGDYWKLLNKIFSNSKLINNMIKCLHLKWGVVEFSYNSIGYSNYRLEFIQKIMKKFINYELRYMDREYCNNENINNIYDSFMIVFGSFSYDYFSNYEFELDVGDQLTPKFVRFLRKRFPHMKYKSHKN